MLVHPVKPARQETRQEKVDIMADASQQSSSKSSGLASCDPVWERIRDEAEELAKAETALASWTYATILNHDNLDSALSYRLALALADKETSALMLREVFRDVLRENQVIGEAVRADIVAVFERDPACKSYLEPMLYFKGFQAIQTYRISHYLWKSGRRQLAFYLQSQMSKIFQVDIHPAARIGQGIMVDHASNIVIGETAVVDDNVSMLHGVTLGGTGKEEGDRHPKIRRGVMLGTGATVLGNIEVGECSRVAAGSVVLKDVPKNSTVAGVPAEVVGEAGCDQPSQSMDQMIQDDGSGI